MYTKYVENNKVLISSVVLLVGCLVIFLGYKFIRHARWEKYCENLASMKNEYNYPIEKWHKDYEECMKDFNQPPYLLKLSKN